MEKIQLFEYQHKQVRTVLIDGEVWFVAKDVCDVLEIVNSRHAVASLPDKVKGGVVQNDSIGRPQQMTVINESGVYTLAFRSTKAGAKKFTDWVTSDVIPAIRKTGKYVHQPQGLLPMERHTDIGVQKQMSKLINAVNYERGGKEGAVQYNVASSVAHSGKTPKALIAHGKKAGLKAKDRTSGKAVLRVLQPAKACCMSLADNLCKLGHEPEKVFKVTKKAEELFTGILELGAEPKELHR